MQHGLLTRSFATTTEHGRSMFVTSTQNLLHQTATNSERNINQQGIEQGDDEPTYRDAYSLLQSILEELTKQNGILWPSLSKILFSADEIRQIFEQVPENIPNRDYYEALKSLALLQAILDRGMNCNQDLELDPFGLPNEDCQDNERHVSTPNDEISESIDELLQCIRTNLSSLLLTAQQCSNTINDVSLELTEPPNEFWHHRTIECLARGKCPCLAGQSGVQRQYPRVRCSDPRGIALSELFFLVQLLDLNKNPHPTKVIVPPNTKVAERQHSESVQDDRKRHTLDDLIIDEKYGFDLKTRRILLPLEIAQNYEDQMNLKFKVFNAYKTNKSQRRSNDSTLDHEQQESKFFILSFQLFWRSSDNQLISRSQPIYSDRIQEVAKPEEVQIHQVIPMAKNPPEMHIVFNRRAQIRVQINDTDVKRPRWSPTEPTTLVIKSQEFKKDFNLKVGKKTKKTQACPQLLFNQDYNVILSN